MKIQKFFALGLIFAALLISANTVYSQDFKKSPEERAQKRAEKLKEKLSLTDDQYKQVYDAFLSQSQQMKSLKEAGEQDKTARREKMKSIRQNTDATVNGLLNSDQKTKYDQLKKERKEKHMQKKKHKKGKKNKSDKKLK